MLCEQHACKCFNNIVGTSFLHETQSHMVDNLAEGADLPSTMVS